jgi:hypothetical protein
MLGRLAENRERRAEGPRAGGRRLSVGEVGSVAAGETDEGAEDVVEAVAEGGIDVWEVAESGSDLEAGEDLAEGTECVVVARGAVLAAAVGALGDVERGTGESAAALASEVWVVVCEVCEERSEVADEVEEHGVDTEHGSLPG